MKNQSINLQKSQNYINNANMAISGFQEIYRIPRNKVTNPGSMAEEHDDRFNTIIDVVFNKYFRMI